MTRRFRFYSPAGLAILLTLWLPSSAAAQNDFLQSIRTETETLRTAAPGRFEVAPMPPTPRVPPVQVKCTTPRLRTAIGAVIGAVGSGVFAAYVNRRPGFVRLPVAKFAIGGAGVGALVGYGICR
jgi:hypothetical protein